MVQGYPQKNSRSSGGRCYLGPNTRISAVFSFRGKNSKEGQSFSPYREQTPEAVRRPRVLLVRISVELTLSNGLHTLSKDLDYLGVYRLNQKLEGLVECDLHKPLLLPVGLYGHVL